MTRTFPFMLVVVAAVACSLLGCAVPFAALAAAAATYCSLRTGVLVVVTAVVLNQVLGFTVHHYPRDPATIAWGVAIGVAALASFGAARLLRRASPAAFVAAFVILEAVLMLFSLRLGDWGAYAPAVLLPLLLVNAAWFAAIQFVARYGFDFHPAR